MLSVLLFASVFATVSAFDDPAAKPPSARRVFFTRIELPLIGVADTQIKRQLDKFVADSQNESERPVVIIEFSGPEGKTGSGSEFERCLSVARFLTSDRMKGMRTVAFVPRTVNGHAVLPILACEEIVIAESAVLGEAGIDETNVDSTMKQAYAETAERRLTIPATVALGMLDRQLAVYRVVTTDGVRIVLDDELKKLQDSAAVSSVDTIVAVGDLAAFTGTELRLKYGFVSHLANDRAALAAALNIPAKSLSEDPSQGAAWQPLLVRLRGPLNAKNISWVERSLRDHLASGSVNLVCIDLNSPGGSPTDSMRLAQYLADLNSARVRTVAYIESEARADSVLIAFACDQIIMGPDAILGGEGAANFDRRLLDSLRPGVQTLANQKRIDWSLPMAMLDPELQIHRYSRPTATGNRYLCADELAGLDDPQSWTKGDLIELREGLVGRRAEEMGVISFNASNIDEVRRLQHVENEFVRIEPNWAHLFIEHLASPRLAGVLLFIGFFMFMMEASSPGVGVPGFISAVCFALYFWSNFLHGTAGWLEVLLFAVGIGCVCMEIFVLPGVGIFGIGGAVLIVTSIVLASQTFVIPRNSYQLAQLPGTILMVSVVASGALGALLMVRKYLAHTPVLNRLLLETPDEDELAVIEQREATMILSHLVGQHGVAMTPLLPSGKARFGDTIVNVVSSGDPIQAREDVIAIEDRGNYLLVQSAAQRT